MAYEAGFRPHLVTIRNKVVATGFGETTQYQDIKTVHAAKTWKHGIKGLREGALDAYDKVLFRMDYNDIVEILAQEFVQGVPAYNPSTSTITGGTRNSSEFGG